MLTLGARSASIAARVKAVRWLKILAADPVDAICGQTFADAGHKLVEKKLTREQLLEQISQYDGLVVRSGVKVTEDIIKAGTKLRIIGRAGAGVDNIDTVAATKAGVIVMNTPGGNTSAAAELTMSLMMSAARQIPQACESLKGGAWDRKKYSNGVELKGKVVGVIGLGMIGTEVARRCQSLDMTTIGFDPLVPADKAAAAGVKTVPLATLFATADFITLHTPLNDNTRNLICKATLAQCKKGVFIINCARGGVVNEADLLEGLVSGKVAGAAIDVFESEPPKDSSRALIAHPGVVCTPHLGASTEEAQKKVAREIASQMSDAFAFKAFVGVVNARHLALAHKPALEPYVRLSEALGSLQGQMLSGPIKAAQVKIDVEGPVFGEDKAVVELVKSAVLKGMLPSMPGSELDTDSVNLLNGPLMADELHLTVSAKQSPVAVGPYANAVRVTIQGRDGERVVIGSVIDGEPRVVQIDHWESFPTFPPEGHILLYNNIDRPGVVSKITGVLAEYNVNLASLLVARQHAGSPALSIVVADQRITADVAHRIAAIDGITSVRTASFGDAFTRARSAE